MGVRSAFYVGFSRCPWCNYAVTLVMVYSSVNVLSSLIMTVWQLSHIAVRETLTICELTEELGTIKISLTRAFGFNSIFPTKYLFVSSYTNFFSVRIRLSKNW